MTDFWNDHPELSADLAEVRRLMSEIARRDDFPASDAMSDLVAGGGKMLRPAFLLLASRFGKPRRPDITRLAAAIELLHTATLIHDDVIDGALTRRGVPTVHARHGETVAVLSGDLLLARCFRLASESASPANARLLARLVEDICVAEVRQDFGAYDFSIGRREYLRRVAGKTALLFSLAFHAGASESKVAPRTAERLRRAGWDIGMAFQIIDDVLDFEGCEETVRKPLGRDLAEGVCTLPLILARATRGTELDALLAKPPYAEETVLRAVAIVRESGAVEAARTEAALYTARALKEIDRLPPNPARTELRAVADKLLLRAC